MNTHGLAPLHSQPSQTTVHGKSADSSTILIGLLTGVLLKQLLNKRAGLKRHARSSPAYGVCALCALSDFTIGLYSDQPDRTGSLKSLWRPVGVLPSPLPMAVFMSCPAWLVKGLRALKARWTTCSRPLSRISRKATVVVLAIVQMQILSGKEVTSILAVWAWFAWLPRTPSKTSSVPWSFWPTTL